MSRRPPKVSDLSRKAAFVGLLALTGITLVACGGGGGGGGDSSPGNFAPQTVDDTASIAEDGGSTVVTGNVRSNDSDTEDPISSLVVSTLDGQPTPVTMMIGTYGTISLDGDGDYTYVLDNALPATNALSAGEIGIDAFSYTIVDTEGAQNSGTLEINVTGANDSPVASGVCSEIALGVTLNEDLNSAVTDPDSVDNGTLTFTGPSTSPKGTVDVAATGTYIYTPNPGARGLDTFTYEVTDGSGETDSGEVRVVIGDTRIMPLGDSLTSGVTIGGPPNLPTPDFRIGYRARLYDQLSAVQGYPVDFVGTREEGSATGLPDDDHQGTPGDTATDTANGVVSWLNANPADIILLHTGTNDFLNTTAADVAAILDNIDVWESSNQPVTVFVARIIGRLDYLDANQDVQDFNDAVASVVAGRTNDRIVVVDQFSVLDYVGPVTDFDQDPFLIHPSQAGYDKMADRWRDALNAAAASDPSLLPRCP